ncbi:hypothetical protein BM1_02605 [Bipolaris maydis]|nr:hypothetical protein BM1_02605 [Bipolaris maydis]
MATQDAECSHVAAAGPWCLGRPCLGRCVLAAGKPPPGRWNGSHDSSGERTAAQPNWATLSGQQGTATEPSLFAAAGGQWQGRGAWSKAAAVRTPARVHQRGAEATVPRASRPPFTFPPQRTLTSPSALPA